MQNECQKFDLSTLLRIVDLDVQGVAKNNKTMQVRDYFNLLSKLIDDGLVVLDALEKIAHNKGDENDFQSLTDMKALLRELECNRFVSDINSILKAHNKENEKLASTYTRGMQDSFKKLYNRVVKAKKKNALSQDEYDDADEKNQQIIDSTFEDTAYLSTVLEQLEREDATRKLRILAVDDAAVMLRTVYSILSEEYEVQTLLKPTMLEALLEHIVPDLFLLDYKMPEINGFELIPIIRNFEEHKDTPIIFLTSMGTIDHVSTAVLHGACDFIIKPVKSDILLKKVKEHIVRKKLF